MSSLSSQCAISCRPFLFLCLLTSWFFSRRSFFLCLYQLPSFTIVVFWCANIIFFFGILAARSDRILSNSSSLDSISSAGLFMEKGYSLPGISDFESASNPGLSVAGKYRSMFMSSLLTPLVTGPLYIFRLFRWITTSSASGSSKSWTSVLVSVTFFTNYNSLHRFISFRFLFSNPLGE